LISKNLFRAFNVFGQNFQSEALSDIHSTYDCNSVTFSFVGFSIAFLITSFESSVQSKLSIADFALSNCALCFSTNFDLAVAASAAFACTAAGAGTSSFLGVVPGATGSAFGASLFMYSINLAESHFLSVVLYNQLNSSFHEFLNTLHKLLTNSLLIITSFHIDIPPSGLLSSFFHFCLSAIEVNASVDASNCLF
jgi:hypothetical protein